VVTFLRRERPVLLDRPDRADVTKEDIIVAALTAWTRPTTPGRSGAGNLNHN